MMAELGDLSCDEQQHSKDSGGSGVSLCKGIYKSRIAGIDTIGEGNEKTLVVAFKVLEGPAKGSTQPMRLTIATASYKNRDLVKASIITLGQLAKHAGFSRMTPDMAHIVGNDVAIVVNERTVVCDNNEASTVPQITKIIAVDYDDERVPASNDEEMEARNGTL